MVADRRMALRLNPFAFPSDTDFRFVLLIVSVLGASLLIYEALYNSLPANTAPLQSSRTAWVIGGVLLLLIVAGVIYWVYPVWKMRRDKLEPLDAEDAPEIVIYLAELCREAGLPSPPLFVVNPLNRTSTGLSFGRLGRYYIALNAGLVTKFYKDRPAFRAVVLHELAHLHNADVDKTYFSLAIGLAFLIAALVPLAISRLGRPLGDTFNIGWRVLALPVLVYLTLSAVLRAREVYADVRASTWDGLAGGLSRVLKGLPQPKGGRWGRYVAFHPDPHDRRRALSDTQHLFRMGFWEAFGTGIAVTIAFQSVENFIPTSVPFLRALGAGLIFAPLIVGVVGSSVWRAALAALARRTMPRGTGRLALGLGLGLLLGQYLSLAALALSTSKFALTGLNRFVFDVLWIGVVLISSWFFLYWIAAGAWTWMEVAVASRSPRPAYRVGLIIAGIWLTVWLGLLFYVYPVSAAGNEIPLPAPVALSLIQAAITSLLINPLTLLAFMSIWAFPLAAWFWRKRVAATLGSSWVFLGPSPLTLPRQHPLRPGLALTMGVAGGVISCALLLLLGFVLYSTMTDDEYLQWIISGQPLVAAVMQAIVAAVVAGQVRRLGSLHGLFAAFVAGCVITAGAVANSLYYVRIDLLLLWLLFTSVVNEGALLALLTALVASVLAGWLRQVTASNPTKTLTIFCHALRSQDYHTAYNQLANHQQVTEAQFASQFGAFIMGNGGLYECSVSDVAEENSTAIAVMRWTLGNRRTQTFSCTLVDASGGWKISLIGLPR